MKISKAVAKKTLETLNEFKFLVGFSDWTILLNTETCDGDNFATVEAEIYEKTLTVEVNKDFLTLTDEKQESVLIHELIHGRVEAYKKYLEIQNNFLEEDLVNDLERGIKRLRGIQND